jgi:hypothetical protein
MKYISKIIARHSSQMQSGGWGNLRVIIGATEHLLSRERDQGQAMGVHGKIPTGEN